MQESELVDTDAFPNCPGLSESLGLKRATSLPVAEIGEGRDKRVWCSICSRHQMPQEGCSACLCGGYVYVNSFRERSSHWVFKLCPPLWRWLVNKRGWWRG